MTFVVAAYIERCTALLYFVTTLASTFNVGNFGKRQMDKDDVTDAIARAAQVAKPMMTYELALAIAHAASLAKCECATCVYIRQVAKEIDCEPEKAEEESFITFVWD